MEPVLLARILGSPRDPSSCLTDRSCSATETPASSAAGTTGSSTPTPRPAARRGVRCSEPTARSTSPRAETCPAAATRRRSAASRRVRPDGTVELVCAEIGGTRWPVPTISPSGPTAACTSPTPAPRKTRVTTVPRAAVRARCLGGGEFLMERPMLYPNGIAFDAEGTPVLDRVARASGLPAR